MAVDLGIGWQYDVACVVVLLLIMVPILRIAHRGKVQRLETEDRRYQEERDWEWPDNSVTVNIKADDYRRLVDEAEGQGRR